MNLWFHNGPARAFDGLLRSLKGRQEELFHSRASLERRVAERTAQLAATIEQLQGEVRDRLAAEKLLRESEDRHRSLVELSPEAVYVTVGGNVAYANPAGVRLLGALEAGDLAGRPLLGFFSPDTAEAARSHFERAGQAGTSSLQESKIVRLDGRTADVEGAFVAIRYGGRPALLGLMRDITDRKEAERRVQATKSLLDLFARKTSRKEYLDSVVEIVRQWSSCSGVGIRVMGECGNVPYESHIGFSRKFWESENPLNLETDSCACVRVMRQAMEQQDLPLKTEHGSFRCDHLANFMTQLSPGEQKRFRGHCGLAGFTSLAIIPIRYEQRILGAIQLADERPGRATGAMVEFLEGMTPLIGEAMNRFNLQEEQRHLEAEVLAISETERQQIGQDLHDRLGQSLSGIAFLSGVLQQKLLAKSPAEATDAAQIEDLVNDSVAMTRSLALDLSPAGIRPESLIPGLRDLAARTQDVFGVSCLFQCQDTVCIHDSLAATHLYRIAQGAVHNAIRQGKAKRIEIQLLDGDDAIRLTVRDNGKGLAASNGAHDGMALRIMRHRASQIGAILQVEPPAAGGGGISCIMKKLNGKGAEIKPWKPA